MTLKIQTALFTLLTALAMPLTGCDRDEGPLEEAAESIEEGAEEVRDELDDHDIIDE